MSEALTPLDVFEAGLTFETYLASMGTLQRQMSEQYETIILDDEAVDPFLELAQNYNPLRILVLTEDYCPDSAMNIPIIARLAEVVPNITLRIARRDKYPALAEQYPAADGVNHIPTVIFMDEGGRELGVWHERPAAAHIFLTKYSQMHFEPERRLKNGAVNPLYRTWAKTRLAAQKVVYRQGVWRETLRELKLCLGEMKHERHQKVERHER